MTTPINLNERRQSRDAETVAFHSHLDLMLMCTGILTESIQAMMTKGATRRKIFLTLNHACQELSVAQNEPDGGTAA